MKRSCLLLVLPVIAASVMSCRVFDRIFNGDIIARIGNDVLYAHQVMDLLPEGCSPEDSAHIVRRYIDSWATRLLVLRHAERNLSKDDRNIEREMAELKSDLLSYRYEMKYVDAHLDTVITETECESYYKANPNSFIAGTYFVKGTFVKIPSSSPNLGRVKRLLSSQRQEDVDELENICYNSADKYFRVDEKWISLSTIASYMDETLSWCEDNFSGDGRIVLQKEGYVYLLYAVEKVSPGELIPFGYCMNHIKEIILGKRKQELVDGLERNLLVDALSSGSLIMYNK